MPSDLGRVLALVASAACLGCLVMAQAQEPHPGKGPYERVCKVCHGADGKGDAAPSLVPFSMDMDELMIRVREGGGEMPPISATRVSDDEVKQIGAYLTSLSPPKEAAGAQTEAATHVSTWDPALAGLK